MDFVYDDVYDDDFADGTVATAGEGSCLSSDGDDTETFSELSDPGGTEVGEGEAAHACFCVCIVGSRVGAEMDGECFGAGLIWGYAFPLPSCYIGLKMHFSP